MQPDLRLSLAAWAGWIAVTLGCYGILVGVLPWLSSMQASLVIVAILSLLVAAGVSLAGWWREVGYTRPPQWRERGWLIVPA